MEGNKLVKDISKTPTGVFYIDGDKAYFYELSLSTPLHIVFPQDIISDLEVINRRKLVSFIQDFAKTQKLSPKNIFILLSNSMTFEKDFPNVSPEYVKSVGEFLELVPFEDHVSKLIPLEGRVKVVVANKELCETIRGTFSHLGYVVHGVFPLSLIIGAIPELETKFDFNLIISRINEFKDFNLTPEVEETMIFPKQEVKSNKRFLTLLGVFVILLIILLLVIIFSIQSTEAPKPLLKG